VANPLAVELHASAAETANGTGAGLDIGATRRAAELTLNVTAAAGTTPQLTVTLETAPTSAGAWKIVGQFAIKQAAGFQRLTFGDLEQFVRASWKVSGTTPDFTFAVSGEAHVNYCDPSELPFLAILEEAIEDLTNEHKIEACLASTGLADSYLGKAYTLPLTGWGRELRRCVGHLIVWDLMVTRGFNPDEYDAQIKVRYDEAIKWLTMISAGELSPPDIVDTTPDLFEGGSFLITEAKRGW
jgi:phage gp36-like protein